MLNGTANTHNCILLKEASQNRGQLYIKVHEFLWDMQTKTGSGIMLRKDMGGDKSTFGSIFHITLLVKRVRILDAAHNVIIISYVQTYVGVTGGQYKLNVICTISNGYKQVVRFIIQYCVPVNILLCVLYRLMQILGMRWIDNYLLTFNITLVANLINILSS